MHFFLLPIASSFLITSVSGWGGGDAHGRGGDAQGGWGDARASCASPLGTPLRESTTLTFTTMKNLEPGINLKTNIIFNVRE